jgi:hypothetical protein
MVSFDTGGAASREGSTLFEDMMDDGRHQAIADQFAIEGHGQPKSWRVIKRLWESVVRHVDPSDGALRAIPELIASAVNTLRVMAGDRVTGAIFRER